MDSIFQRVKEIKRGHCKIGWFLSMHEMQIREEIFIIMYMLWFNFIFGLIFFQTSSFFSTQFHFFRPVQFF